MNMLAPLKKFSTRQCDALISCMGRNAKHARVLPQEEHGFRMKQDSHDVAEGRPGTRSCSRACHQQHRRYLETENVFRCEVETPFLFIPALCMLLAC